MPLPGAGARAGFRPGLAAGAQAVVLARCAAAMRGAVGTASFAAALLAPATGVVWWWAGLVGAGAWTVLFVRGVLRRGLTGRLLAGEVLVTGALCLGQRWVLAPSTLPDGVSWVAVVQTTSMVVVSFALRPPRAVPVCLLLALAHLLGARWAGGADGGTGSAVIHVLQIASLAILMTLLRRAARLVDDVMAGLALEQQVSAAAASRRREEEARSDELHTTVLATITAVAAGGLAASTPVLREQSARAVQVVSALRQSPVAPAAPAEASLAERLQAVADAAGAAGVRVRMRVAAVRVPPAVAEALTGAVEEVLGNVGRHAGTGEADVDLAVGTDGPPPPPPWDRVEVVVSDEGPGFDPERVPVHKYGVRHAVVAAMRRVDGEARVDAAPGRGTRVLLRWPA